MVKNLLIKHREMITVAGALVGLVSIGYGTYRMMRAEDRSFMERLEAVAVIGGGFLSRHRHPAPVHGFVIKGSWRYLEHDWVAKEGSYLFEPPGEIHTLVVDQDCDEMITLFHNSGALLYCDENGKTINSTDVFDRVDAARKHFVKVGLGEDYVNQFIR